MTEVSHASPESNTDPLIGQIVQGFRVECVLGAGGMGVVYEVRHVDLKSLAALKTLQPGQRNSNGDEMRKRFVNEAHALSRVTDEGLVKIFNFGHLPDGTPYIVMERLVGQTLHQRLAQSPGKRMPVGEVLALLEQAAGTLATLHQHGVIHRDIKPENIMLVEDKVAPSGRRLKLLDFGIAKLVEPVAANLTQGPLGTPLYMSPESCRGESVTAQTDVYSLGCVAYQMLCGRPPYESDTNDVLRQHRFNTPEPVHSRAADVSNSVAALIMQMLARKAQARPTMEEVSTLARQLRIQPGRLYRTRIRWALLRLWHHKFGKGFALLSSMPILVLILVVVFGLVTSSGSLWIDRWVTRSWRSPLVRIPAGRFTMGSTDEEIAQARELVRWYAQRFPQQKNAYFADYINSPKNYFEREQPTSELDVPAFEIERYEVTNAEFVEFLNAPETRKNTRFEPRCPTSGKPGYFSTDSTCIYLADSGQLYKNLDNSHVYGGIRFSKTQDGQGHYVVEPFQKNRPVVSMTWQAANDYCRWRYKGRGRLPTEVEWEYAARRSSRRFPWGAERPECEHAIVERCDESHKFCACKPKALKPELPEIGSASLDRTAEGVMDLSGSVAEWTNDWLHAKLPQGPLKARLDTGQVESSLEGERGYRVIRGGSWSQDFLTTRTAGRVGAPAHSVARDIGIRCVREVKP